MNRKIEKNIKEGLGEYECPTKQFLGIVEGENGEDEERQYLQRYWLELFRINEIYKSLYLESMSPGQSNIFIFKRYYLMTMKNTEITVYFHLYDTVLWLDV